MQTPVRKFILLWFLGAALLSVTPRLQAQNTETRKSRSFSGTICDAEKRPLSGVEVTLESTAHPGEVAHAKTDAQGHFEFEDLAAGRYRLQSDRTIHQAADTALFFDIKEGQPFILQPCWVQPASRGEDTSEAIAFSDEPQFVVAGVTDTTALGVHSSSRTMPNSNALTKDTVALAHEKLDSRSSASSDESSIRAKLGGGDNADLRFQLAEIEEKEGHALEAEKDYQHAAELAPTESHLFAWGAELLLHHAFEPAIEVFRKGNRLYPGSVRILLGLGAAYYAQGSPDQAAQFFLRASALDPANPQPYLFLGCLLPTANLAPQAWVEAMKRFTTEHFETAMAHYLYGFALAKQGDEASVHSAELQLNKAIGLDPHLGDAYLQLGILKSNRGDFSGAIADLQKAVEFKPFPDEAHYRLAEIYRRTGEPEKARQETALYKQISEQKSQDAERERREIQQFIYTLSGLPSPPQPATPNPRWQ